MSETPHKDQHPVGFIKEKPGRHPMPFDNSMPQMEVGLTKLVSLCIENSFYYNVRIVALQIFSSEGGRLALVNPRKLYVSTCIENQLRPC